MQSDWDSLFFTYRPHPDQQPHETHLLADMGLIRTADGGLALAEDPMHRVELERPNLWERIFRALSFNFRPRPVAAGHRR
ncbi:hypothetical protein [Dongia rigui]|uniref:Uncharacterized protein n=1 Tax=Dongia rigui TaxID=940149 RepID=A0ABU5DVZ1_9PROT|nr:hypothetical protein [Dongia rigui]MDY0871476.1 hypothetical protein [Dongia rigui]